MNFADAVFMCKVRGYIARKSNLSARYWKNHPMSLETRVPVEDQKANDWETFDPEGEATSIVG